jgi:hypothetical protein
MSRFAEHHLQASCVRWFRMQYPRLLLFAVPNGATLSGDARMRAQQWARLEAEGAIAGAADLFLAVPRGEFAGLFIEMKTPRGKQSDRQKEFEKRAIEAGYGYAVPRTFDQFVAIINQYLKYGYY